MAQINPSIRVFISSTFLDMQNERDVLNQDVFPLIKGRLEKLGINFTIVDLRWGITKEDQIKNNVIDLCLGEIEHCKPYFIGLIGNRYGWCPDKYEDDILLKYPFINDNKDKSVTELEMILGALAAQNKERCFFYFKDKCLFDNATNDGKDKQLKELKEKVTEQKISNHTYTSFDEFKEQVINDLTMAIEEDYPSEESTSFIKQSAYLNLTESKYVNRLFFTAQAIDMLTYAENNHVAVMAYSKDPIGKSTVFTHLINSKKDVDKIIINLKADTNLRYFPAYGLYKLIEKGLNDIGIELVDYEETPVPELTISFETYSLALLSNLRKNLYSLKLDRPLYILINDVDLLFDNDISQAFIRHFLFDDQKLPNNLYVVLTSNSEKQTRMMEHIMMGEMHPDTFGSKDFFKDYLAKFAKKIDDEILNNASKSLTFIDYKLIADYLIYYCNYSSYQQSATKLVSKNNTNEILMFILEDFLSKLSPKCASLFAEILIRLTIFEIGMSENMIFDSYNKDTAIEEVKEHQVYVDISEIEKASIMRCLRYFTDSSSGVIVIEDNVMLKFLKANIKYLFDVVSASYEERSQKAVNDLFDEMSFVSKYGRTYTKEEYLELLKNNDEKSRNIAYAILDPLSAYLDKIIQDYSKTLDEDSYYPFEATDKEIEMLAFIQESARIYKLDTRLDLYQKLLANKDLMFFITSKSKTLAKRLIAGYIELYETVLKNQYGKVREEDIIFSVDYTFSYIPEKLDAEKESRRISLLLAISHVLYEKKMYQGKIIETLENEGRIFFDLEDFALTTCSNATNDFAFDYENDMLGDGVTAEALRDYLAKSYQGYLANSSVFEKLIYAYYYFRAMYLLVDNDLFRNEDYEPLKDMLQNLESHLSYCYYPEVYAFYDMFFGRLFPKNYLYRLELGMNVLKYLGFDRTLERYQEVYDYLRTQFKE